MAGGKQLRGQSWDNDGPPRIRTKATTPMGMREAKTHDATPLQIINPTFQRFIESLSILGSIITYQHIKSSVNLFVY